jgi:nucleotide-binding universal stress UspA family protein
MSEMAVKEAREPRSQPGGPMEDIVALVTSTGPWSPAALTALALAAQFGSHVTGCYVDMSLRANHGGNLEPTALALLLDAPHENHADRDAFQATARRMGVLSASWAVTRTNIAGTMRQVGAWHDLIVIERDILQEPTLFDALGEALVACRSPCLLLPPFWDGRTDFKRVVIAWNGSIESVRAIHAALPFAKAAHEVIVIDGETPHLDDEQEQDPPFFPLNYLLTHGISAKTHRIQVTPREAGNAIWRLATLEHADLLVMGAYGRSRLRERTLGGATQYLLHHATIPMLVQH